MRKPEIAIEFPDFGFGPASTALRLIARLSPRWRCVVASTGAALRLVRRALPSADTVDVDTFDPKSMARFGDYVEDSCFVLSVTNPAFASWATGSGYRVGVVDTLRWMWDDDTAAVDGAAFYVTQHYWGRRGAEMRPGEVLAAPDPIKIRAPRRVKASSRRALVTFGGMSLPLDKALPLEFADWVIAHLVPVLLQHPSIDGVDVVGGDRRLADVCAGAHDCAGVRTVGMLAPHQYLDVLRRAPVVVATPGIATVHELQWARSRAFLLPGHNLSQLLQLRDAIESLGYRHTMEWPDAENLADTIRGLPEEAGTRLVATAARSAMATPTCGRALAAAVERVATDERPVPRLPDATGSRRLPPVSGVVTGFVKAEISGRNGSVGYPRGADRRVFAERGA